MKLRPATHSDTKTIATIHSDSWRKYYSNDLSKEYLENIAPGERIEVWGQRLSSPKQNQYVVVAEDKNETVGFACVYANKNPEWGSYLDNLHVVEAYQSKGVGKLLLQDIFRWCNEAAPDVGLCLLVNQSNSRAQKFYINNGARNQQVSVWNAPDGNAIPTYWFVWDKLQQPTKRSSI